jgi:chromosome segregation ATPase
MLKDAIRTMQQQRLNAWSDRKPEIRQFMETLSDERAAVYGALSIAQQKKIMQEGANALDRFQIRNINKTELYKNRIVAREQLERARNAFEMAKERYNNAVERHDEAVNRWKEARQNLTNCAGTDECDRLEARAVEQAKRFLQNHIELASSHLEKIKNRAEESERLTEAQVDQIVDAIEADLAQLAELKEEAEAAETKEEIKQIAKTLNEMWKKAMVKAKVHAEIIAGSITGEVIQRSEQLEKRLTCVLEQLDEQNLSTTELESLIEQFSDEVASAEQHFENAKELFGQFREMRNDTMTEDLIEQYKELHAKAQEEHKAANADLREAHAALVQITKKIREMGGRLDACDEEETSVIVDEE